MIVKSFLVKNYKSIKDSGICYVDRLITILAGKNEAGKTAILEALEDFNINKNIRDEGIPIADKEAKPEITITFLLEKKDLKKLEDNFNVKIKNEDIKIIITKKYRNNYEIDLEKIIELIFPNEKNTRNQILHLIKYLKDIFENFPLNEEYITNQPYYIPDPEKIFASLKEKENMNNKDSKKKLDELKKLINEYNIIKEFKTNCEEFIKNNLLPNFILFRTFNDILPAQIPINEAQRNEIVNDLALISNLDFSKIQPSSPPEIRKRHEEEINIKFSREYTNFWTQDHSNLSIWWDSNNIYFRVKEGDEYYPLEMRSKGRQWHLAFYIRVTARSKEDKDNIILIDEPGLFLHAAAQKDILKKLEECSKEKQIIYTTHSPYLIPTYALNRVRLVIKTEDGTKIEKITTRTADKETLTPILTAIGEDLTGGIRVDRKNSVVVEGFSDYLWLISFKKLLGIKENINFIPAVGADNCFCIGAILFGWRLNPIFILDNDKKGKNVAKKLQGRLGISEERIILVPFDKEGCIEDLFSEKFKQKFLDTSKEKGKVLLATILNQQVIKEKITKLDLDEITLANFEELFEKLISLVNENDA